MHRYVRGKKKKKKKEVFRFSFFLFSQSESMTLLDSCCAATAAPESETLSCQYREREREQLHCRTYHISTEDCSSTNKGTVTRYGHIDITPTSKPNKSSHDTMITTTAHDRGKKEAEWVCVCQCRPRRGSFSIVN